MHKAGDQWPAPACIFHFDCEARKNKIKAAEKQAERSFSAAFWLRNGINKGKRGAGRKKGKKMKKGVDKKGKAWYYIQAVSKTTPQKKKSLGKSLKNF